jgi:flagellar hook-associated protein 2
VTGSPGELLIDDQGLNLGLKQMVAAQDALLRYGASGGAGSILVASSSNTFKDLLPGLTIDLKKVETTPAPVTITVKEDRAALGDTVSSVVEQLNRFFAKVAELTSYDPETDTAAALQGDTTVLRVQADVVGVISRRVSGGTINSVFQLGINFSKDGKLEFDRGKLEAAVAADPQAVRDFLTRSGGLADELDTLAERLAGVGTGTLVGRAATVANRIQRNTDRVKFLNERLDGYRELLLRQFNQAELAISKVRSIQGALDQVAQLAAVRSG